MSEKITYSLNIQVTGGPRITASRTIDLEAYDKVTLTVPQKAAPTDPDVELSLQPGGVGLAKFLIIIASSYDKKLTYKINQSDAPEITLDGPQLFTAEGAVGLLYNPPLSDASPAPPTTLYFSNTTAAEVSVQILVGRDATP